MADRKKAAPDTDYAAIVKAMIDDAADYIDGFVAPARAKATAYYRGDAFGNEEEGRSQVVMTEVRDVVQGMLPSLLRVFTAGENVVEYVPRTQAGVEIAEQATDYVNYVFYNDNNGFQTLHSFMKDGLIRKLGIIKWRWSEDTEISEVELSGLGEMQLQMLDADETCEIVSKKSHEVAPAHPAGVDPTTGQPTPEIPAVLEYDVRVKRRIPRNKIVIECVPPEEFLISREARDLDTAMYVGHRSLKTVSELVAMGYDRKEIEEYAGSDEAFDMNYEAQTRNPGVMSMLGGSPDEATKRVLYTESYARIDKDGDGIAELRRICSLGAANHILHDEIADETPFATFCPDPEPHMVIGQSVADQVMDLQILKSGIVRNTMDSLAQSIHPRTWVVEGQTNMDDVMNVETGAIIRMRAPGMAGEFSQAFLGQAAMPVLAYLDDVRAQRTGVSKASQGLDPDVLQSTTKTAVDATVQGAQERLEMVSRILAETGMKRLFKGLLRAICKHQDKPRTIRLRGKWVEIDPRYWDAEMDVHVNVGLGKGNAHDQMQFLMLVAQKQEQIIQMLGPANPVCDISQYRNTLGKILELGNRKDTTTFFKAIDQNTVAQMQQAMQQKPQQSPDVMLAQIEMEKAKNQAQHNEQKMQLDLLEAKMLDARERDKNMADNMLRAAEMKAKYGAQIDLAHINNQYETQQNLHSGLMQGLSAHNQATTAAATDVQKARIAAEAQQQAAANAPNT